MSRRVYYRKSKSLLNVMLGVNVSEDMYAEIMRSAEAAQLSRSEGIRRILERGLQALQADATPTGRSA